MVRMLYREAFDATVTRVSLPFAVSAMLLSGEPLYLARGIQSMPIPPARNIGFSIYPLFLLKHLSIVGIDVGDITGLLIPPHQVPDRRVKPVCVPQCKR